MNKYKELTKLIVKQGVITIVVVALVGAVYAGIYFYAESVAKTKAEAETKLGQDEALFNNLKGQMDQSGEAEKRFALIMSGKTTSDFSMNQEMMQAWLKNASTQFRLGSLKLTRASEVPAAKSELMNFNETVSLRPAMKLEFEAVSDLHAFSFIDSLVRSAPGLIRIDSVVLTRKSDIRDDVLSNIRNGVMPLLIEAKIDFSWIGLAPKTARPNASSATPPSPQGN